MSNALGRYAVRLRTGVTVKGPANYLALLVQRATMTGIVVSDYYGRAGEAAMVMGGWIQSGKLVLKIA